MNPGLANEGRGAAITRKCASGTGLARAEAASHTDAFGSSSGPELTLTVAGIAKQVPSGSKMALGVQMTEKVADISV
jgi:hypothetical protein